MVYLQPDFFSVFCDLEVYKLLGQSIGWMSGFQSVRWRVEEIVVNELYKLRLDFVRLPFQRVLSTEVWWFIGSQ